jgi:hypothetical protein
MKLAKTDIDSVMYRPSQITKRSLGGAIFLVAIADYCSPDEQEHNGAEQFLYPQTREWQEHYAWAVALAEGLNPAWLRDALDRFRGKWDETRAQRTALATQRALKRSLKSDRRNRPNEEQRSERIHPDGLLVPAKHMRSSHLSLQPARTVCAARTADVAPGL